MNPRNARVLAFLPRFFEKAGEVWSSAPRFYFLALITPA